ncbi:presqualene diphosphate synthase HpnD [Neisseria shayeganii]|nr:presqualene diphosphate synthase HpnD [Neisseria shayeganii]
MTPYQYCEDKAAASGSSFLAGFRFLNADKRRAMTVLYAYCRELDDVADDCSDAHVAAQTLAWWRQDLAKAFHADGVPEHPVHQALRMEAPKYGLPESELAAVIDGMEMDVQPRRYADFAALAEYCHCVAGVVGRLIARILGFRDPAVLAYADKMGLALQLTNIIRDVGEDAAMGRLYLPVEDLQRFKVPAADILQRRAGPQFAELMAFQVARARETYREAVRLLPAAERKNQRAGLIMAAIYYALLNEIERDGAANVLRYKLAIPKPRKIRLALKTWLMGFQP